MASNNIPLDGTQATTGMSTDIGEVQVDYQPSDAFILASFLLPSSTTATVVCAPSQQQQQVVTVSEEACNGPSPQSIDGGNNPSKDDNGNEDERQRKHDYNLESKGTVENKENETEANPENNGQSGYFECPQRGFSILRHLLENGKRPHTFQRLEPPCFEYFRRQQAQCSSTARMFVPVNGNFDGIYYDENNQPITYAMNCVNNCPYLENGVDFENEGWNYVPAQGEMRMEYFVNSHEGQMEMRRSVGTGRGNRGRIQLSDDELELTSGSSAVGEDEEDDDDDDRLVIDEGAGGQEVEMGRYANQQMEPLNLSCR